MWAKPVFYVSSFYACGVSKFLGFYGCAVSKFNFVEGYAVLATLFLWLTPFLG